MKLPPLNAVRAFEAAARTGSFVAAAGELGVSSAAVSMQVRNLEAFLNKKLFDRSNNRITLTDAGTSIYPSTAAALNGIAGMTERLLESEGRPQLVISVLPSLGERWLVRKLAGAASGPVERGLEIRLEEDPVDLVQGRIDLRVTYGMTTYPEFRSLELFRDEVTPMHAAGSVSASESHRNWGRIPDEQLIHVDWGESFASYPSWTDWFRAAGIDRRPDIRKGLKVASSSMAISLAARGLGIALGQRELAGTDLAQGAVVAPSSISLPLSRPYCAVSLHAKARFAPLASLLDRLMQ